MNFRIFAGIAGAVIAVAGVAGCSTEKDSTTDATTATKTTVAEAPAPTEITAPPADPGTAKVWIDGKEQKVAGQLTCSTGGGSVNIAVGTGPSRITAVVGEGDNPDVKSVALGTVEGMALGFTQGRNDLAAKAFHHDGALWVTGIAGGVDEANPQTPVYKAFKLEANCP